MAFRKSIEDDSGTSASYWHIAEIHLHVFRVPVVRIVLLGYRDEATRRAGRYPIPGASREFFFREAECAPFNGLVDVRAAGYVRVKALRVPAPRPEDPSATAPGEFADATDV